MGKRLRQGPIRVVSSMASNWSSSISRGRGTGNTKAVVAIEKVLGIQRLQVFMYR
jgi:hypothetical protein